MRLLIHANYFQHSQQIFNSFPPTSNQMFQEDDDDDDDEEKRDSIFGEERADVMKLLLLADKT